MIIAEKGRLVEGIIKIHTGRVERKRESDREIRLKYGHTRRRSGVKIVARFVGEAYSERKYK